MSFFVLTVSDLKPTGLIVVENGKCIEAGAFTVDTPVQDLNWDLRAQPEAWAKVSNSTVTVVTDTISCHISSLFVLFQWVTAGRINMGAMMKPGSWGGLKFKKGNYGAMIKNPSMMGPFLRSFQLMGKITKINTDE